MGFVDSIRTCFQKYFTFSGRAARPEYWWFFLLYFVISLIPIVQIVVLAMIIPMLAVTWRRLHDVNKPGWWALLPTLVALPFFLLGGMMGGGFETEEPSSFSMILFGIGSIIALGLGIMLLVWLASRGTPGPNNFGPPPVNAGHGGKYSVEN